ncbi:MAG TPA: flavin reductase [Pyrinomonadaceae bacterium]|nr:flavin reductase [Pyrinomonadaceae bacterium]
MIWPGRTIWDTRAQSVCGIISAKGEVDPELFGSASFAQFSVSPPRVIINPNRTYPIESAIHKAGRFAINVLPASERNLMIKLMGVRRRQPGKANVLGIQLIEDSHGIPFLAQALRVVFCEVERTVESGDRRLYVARVLESRVNPNTKDDLPLLFPEVSDRHSLAFGLPKPARKALLRSGLWDVLKRGRQKLRPAPPPNIALTTYEEAGATEEELVTILKPGALDSSRYLTLPSAPAVLRKEIGVCVVGTGWGAIHCRYLRQASPKVRLFVCGRNPDKTARLARAVGAESHFIGAEQAAADSRVQALTLALPHDLHREAVSVAAGARKHALVEKPIATTLEDADAMIRAAEEANTILMVAEDMHFRPAVHEALRSIQRGDIGEPLYLLAHAGGVRRPKGWAAEKDRMGGGVLIDIGVHYIRGLRLLLGEPDTVIATRAMQINTRMSEEDSVQLVFSSKAGWQAHMLISWSSQRGHLPDIVVAGENGTLHLWPRTRYIDYYPVAPRPLTRIVSEVRPYWLQEKLMSPRLQRTRIKLHGRDVTGYLGEMEEFVAAVAEERPPVTSANDGRRDLEIVMRCYEALRTGHPVGIPAVGRENPA